MEAKIIEDRALEKYPIFISEYSDSCIEYDSNESDRLVYIEGATVQRKIDIDKACEWIKNNMAHFWHTDEDSIVSNFRKAMEHYPDYLGQFSRLAEIDTKYNFKSVGKKVHIFLVFQK